jgi:exopolysaccharide biosynthesis polyprenyl glycosylphosphotransferase
MSYDDSEFEFYSDVFFNAYFSIFLILFALIILTFYLHHLYKYQLVLKIISHSFALVKSLTIAFVLTIFIVVVFKAESVTESRMYWFSFYIYLLITFLFIRVLFIPFIYHLLVRKSVIRRNMIIVGAGKYGLRFLNKVRDTPGYFKPIGFVDDDPNKQNSVIEGLPVLGKISEIKRFINEQKVSDIFITINNISYENLSILIHGCKKGRRRIHVASILYNIVVEKLEIEEIAGTTFFRVLPSSNLRINSLLKKTVDIILSSIIIITLSPFLIFITLIIKSTSRGPVFYKAKVIGKEGKPFIWYKFRSMKLHNDDSVHQEFVKDIIKNNKSGKKLENDNRITKFGKKIRKYSIDELPQLINVIKGDMSLVGPRPKLPYEYELMEDWQKKRFNVEPGITGIWQVGGRNEVKFNDEIVLDLYYVENISIKLDFEILLKTIPVVFFGRTGK